MHDGRLGPGRLPGGLAGSGQLLGPSLLLPACSSNPLAKADLTFPQLHLSKKLSSLGSTPGFIPRAPSLQSLPRDLKLYSQRRSRQD